VDLLLSRGACIDEKDQEGRAALHYAVTAGSEKLVELLLSKGANPNMCGSNRRAPLHEAAEKGLTALVKLLVKKGAYCDMRLFPQGDTPLHLAANAGHREIVDFLTSHGATIQESEPLRKMRLEEAFLKWDREIARTIYERGGHGMLSGSKEDLNKKIQKIEKYLYPGALDRLLKKVKPLPREHTLNKMGRTPLHEAVLSGDIKALETMLSGGANPNIADSTGLPPLFEAVKNNNPAMVNLLLEHHAFPNVLDTTVDSLLHMAIRWGSNETAALLIRAGADVNAPNNLKETPLHYAVMGINKQLVHLLLENGANPTLKEKDCGFTPRELVKNSKKIRDVNPVSMEEIKALGHVLLDIEALLQKAEDRAAGKTRLK
jgi:ankyrin repeat protein